ncbi:hypothetical protein [Halobacillus sp. K22]|uniref:hypothetical protein n=1 Tax=Halobacillus sp. K22 TaxID=3457431 RepID=UPI003FCD2114
MRKLLVEGSAIVSVLIFYAAGSLFDLSWLQFHYSNDYSSENGRSVEFGGSFLPLILGVMVYLIVRKMMSKKSST